MDPAYICLFNDDMSPGAVIAGLAERANKAGKEIIISYRKKQISASPGQDVALLMKEYGFNEVSSNEQNSNDTVDAEINLALANCKAGGGEVKDFKIGKVHVQISGFDTYSDILDKYLEEQSRIGSASHKDT